MDSTFVKGLFDSFRTMTDPLFERIKAVEKRVSEMPIAEKGERGEPGKDAEPVSLEQLHAAIVSAVSKDEHGLRGVLEQFIEHAVAERVKALPAPEPVLVTGPAGPAGPAGADGKDAEIDPEFIRTEVAKAVAAIPPPKDGQDGAPGAPGVNGRDGVDGKDGVGLAGAMQSKDGTLVLTLTNGDIRDVGKVVGRDGIDGRDGERGEKGLDGFGFDDLRAEYDGERTVTIIFEKAGVTKTFPFTMPIVLDRGVFTAGKQYEPGDGVTWGGSFYIAQKATTAKPGESSLDSRAWRLSVKRGGDGKVGPIGPQGPMGLKGDPGPQGRMAY